ncbi:MAG TPA: ATP-binding protein [Prosthecobacter sp.]
MSISSNTRSFRIRLALQTMLVAGVLVAAVGAAAWWYTGRVLERAVDDRIVAPAQRVWSRIDPRTTDEEFKAIADLVFGTSPSQDAPAALLVKEHQQGRTLFASPNAPRDLEEQFRLQFPTEEEIRNSPPDSPGPPPRRRPPPQDGGGFDEILGLPPRPGFSPGREGPPGGGPPGEYEDQFDGPPEGGPPGSRGGRLPFRPQMPLIREPVLFTARSTGGDWRFGAFSSPQYTLFIGLSLTDYYAELNRMARWFAAMGLLGLTLAGFGALWTSKRAMRPLERAIRTAQRLTASDLAERIHLSRDDDREFAQLIDVLNGMMERLQSSFQQAVRFTADASHELKTPLAVMLADLDDAVRHAAPGSAEHERFVSLFEEANRLRQITQSLLLLSQADAGRLPTHPEVYDLGADLARLLEDGEILCEQAGLTLEHHLSPQVFVQADRALLRQVFQNLLGNAIKYNRPQGHVRLDLVQQEGVAVFTIANTGPGIPLQHQPRLFERFFRGDAARNRQTDGFGLGLNIATELARANGAEIRLLGSQQDRTVFEVRLAAVPAAGEKGAAC